jgi:hypothetical protein
MLILLLLFYFIRYLFGGLADSRNRNKAAWILIAIVFYFGAQLVGGVIWALTSSEDAIMDKGTEIGIGLGSGVIGLAIAYAILYFLPDLNDVQQYKNPDILDDDF